MLSVLFLLSFVGAVAWLLFFDENSATDTYTTGEYIAYAVAAVGAIGLAWHLWASHKKK